MGLDVTRIRQAQVQDFQTRTPSGNGQEHVKGSTADPGTERAEIGQKARAETYLREILHLTETFNKKLKFQVNKELGQVVVKVLDRQTDKLIKEIPPEELQKLHVRIKEAIGLIIDEQI